MVEAHKRNPNIVLDILPWGAPGWIGNGKYYSPDMAEYMARFIEDARDKYGLKINYAGIWNETVHDDAYVKKLHETLASPPSRHQDRLLRSVGRARARGNGSLPTRCKPIPR